MLGELDVGHSPYFFQWQSKQLVCPYAIRQTPSRYTKGIAKNMEQILCLAFINNDLVITFHSMEEDIQHKRKTYHVLICLKVASNETEQWF
jgi:hypothetical protein